jgi:hypothetical protein
MTKKLFPILIAVFVTACICVLLAGGALLFPNIRSELELHPVYQVSDTFMLNLKLGRYEDAKIFLDDELAAQLRQPDDVLGLLGAGQDILDYERGATWRNTAYGFSHVEIAYAVTFTDGSQKLLFLSLEKPAEYWKVVDGVVKEAGK